MRIYSNPEEMVIEVERELLEMGLEVQSHSVQDKYTENDENYKTMELVNYGYILSLSSETTDIPAWRKAFDYLKGDLDWCIAEFKDRINPTLLNPGSAFCSAKSSTKSLWSDYLERNGRFAYTYNERFRTQLPYLQSEILTKPRSRHLVLTVYDAHQDLQNIGGRHRVPCSMHYQFTLRQNRLHCLYVMRSCDFYKHFIHDVFLAVKLMQYFLPEGTEMGNLTHVIGSLHAFKKDLIEREVF